MTKKYFFFDIDGTLTDRYTGIIVPSAARAIEKLKAAGHFVSIATGRAYYKAEGFRAANGFPNMVCNGGHGIVIDGVLRENAPMDREKSIAVYKEARALGYGVLVAAEDSKKVWAEDFKFYEQVGPRREETTYIIDEDFDIESCRDIYKLYVSVSREEESRLTKRDTLGKLRFQPDYLMFQPDEKKAGILKALEYVGAEPENVVVFGDDTNDLVMFDEKFYCVAMGNACDELKARADFVAEKNTDDGIYKACLEHGWF